MKHRIIQDNKVDIKKILEEILKIIFKIKKNKTSKKNYKEKTYSDEF